jgi:dolichol kinase
MDDQPASTEAGYISSVPLLTRPKASRQEISVELTRKSIHLLIAFVPLINSISHISAISLLSAGIIAYTICEYLRMHGVNVPLISALTVRAARPRDFGKYVLGPITLGLGALIAVLAFSPSVAAISVYVLAFGDGLSSLAGKIFGRIRLPLSTFKSIEGSLVCLVSSFLVTFAVCRKPLDSLLIALMATLVEAIPTQDWDNIILPLFTGTMALLLGL